MKTLIAIVMVMALVPGLAMAGPWTAADIAISGTTGNGSNASYLVVDFGSAAYAYEYLWDAGSPTGFDMMTALQNSTVGFSFTYHTAGDFGAMIDTITCGEQSGTSDYPNPWWNYWTGRAGAVESAWEGCSSSLLTDSSVDAWVFSTDWTQSPTIPGVPEPSTLIAFCSLIGLTGSVGLLRRRSK